MTHGDPKRVVGAYLTNGRRGRRTQLLATTTARGGRGREPQEGREGRRARERRRQDSPPIRPSNMFQATEGRWGSREVEIADVALLDQRRPAVVRVPLRRSDVDPR